MAEPLFRAHSFTATRLVRLVSDASGMPPDEPCDQVRYLASYLSNVAAEAQTIVEEKPYIDRHFLEEFTAYYATSLRPPEPRTVRLHFFRSRMSTEEFFRALHRAAKGAYDEVRNELEQAYLGFVVVRPLPFAPVGRTILRPYTGKESRCFVPASTRHQVHLAGIELEFEGLPFQQQDQAVGACATTAIWSSLSRVMRADGQRPVPPSAITAAATKHRLTSRPFPAVAGLDQQQILEAIRTFGYAPDLTKAGSASAPRGLVELIIKCYVRTGIPVILQVQDANQPSIESHAIAVAGFRESDAEEGAPDIVLEEEAGGPLRSRGLSRLYVHDDRLGPYARMRFIPGEDCRLAFDPQAPGFDAFAETVTVLSVIAPLYPKLRLSASDLIEFATDVMPLVSSLRSGIRQEDVSVDLRFALAGRYQRELYDQKLDPERVVAFSSTTALSRYIGVIRFFVRGEWIADILCDTTDIRRKVPNYAPVVAAIVATPHDAANVQAFFSLGTQQVVVV